MKFEDAMRSMLRDGRVVRRLEWPEEKCMFIDLNMRRAKFIVRAEKWDNKHCALVSDDIIADDWEFGDLPKDERYLGEDIKPSIITR